MTDLATNVDSRKTWELLLADMKRAAEDPEARYAVVDAWTAYITQLEQHLTRMVDCHDFLEHVIDAHGGDGASCAAKEQARSFLGTAP